MTKINLHTGEIQAELPVRLSTAGWINISASYKAFVKPNTWPRVFLIARLATFTHTDIPLGQCVGEDRAQRMINWWVQNDHRVSEIIRGESEEEIEDLIIECARMTPKEGEKAKIVCAHCMCFEVAETEEHFSLYKYSYSYLDDRSRRRRASLYLHDACVASYMRACPGRSFWTDGEQYITPTEEPSADLEQLLKDSLGRCKDCGGIR